MTQSFNAAGNEMNMNIVKSASKLNGCVISLYRAPRTGVDADKANYSRHDGDLGSSYGIFAVEICG